MAMPKQKEKQNRSLRLVKSKSMEKKDWSVPYLNVKEVGRGLLQNEKKITDIIIRYYSYDSSRFEKTRYFAEVQGSESEKFILDCANLESLIEHVTNVALPIFQCRKKIKFINNKKFKLVNKQKVSM